MVVGAIVVFVVEEAIVGFGVRGRSLVDGKMWRSLVMVR